MFKRFVIAILVLIAVQRSARAHDIGVSNATFYVRSTGIDVELFMGLNAAALLIAGAGEQIVITPNGFPDYADRLKAVAPDLFVVTTGDGVLIATDASSVSMSEQTDCVFNLHYPLPANLPATIKIHASYLDRMVENHVATIYVMNGAGDRYGLGELNPRAQDMEAHIPAAALTATAHLSPATAKKSPRFLWFILVAGAVVVTILLLGGARSIRKSFRHNHE